VLLEREAELTLLARLVADVTGAGGKVVLIRGEAGIGKSALVREFLRASADGAHLHVGFCDDLQTPQPYGPLWDVARGVPTLRRALQDKDRQAVFEACFELLSVGSRPNVVVLEDCQWSDQATLDAIKFMGRRIARTDGLLVLTYRDGEVDDYHPLRRVIGDVAPESVVRIGLSGLSRSAVSAIVGASSLDPDRVLEATDGNPFLVTEMASAAADHVPPSVRDSVMARVCKLSVQSRRVLRILSVIPRRLSLGDASNLTQASGAELAECARFGLLEVGDEIVAFRHDLIRRAVEASLTISEGVAIHRALLAALPADTDPAWLMHHAKCGNDLDRLMILGPLAAGAAKAVGSNQEAAAHFRSLGPYLSRFDPRQRADVLSEWAQVEHYLENVEAIEIIDRAIELYREVGCSTSLARALVLRVGLGRTFGRFATAHADAVEAVEILDRAGPSADLAVAIATHAWVLIHSGTGRPEAEADRAIAVAESAGGAELATITALGVKGVLRYVRGQRGGVDVLEQVRERARRGRHRYEEAWALFLVTAVALEIRDLDRAADYAQQARNTAARYELPMLETKAAAAYVNAQAWSGAWTEAEDLAIELLGRHSHADVSLLAVVGALRTRRGRGGGREHLERAWSMARDSGEIDQQLVSAAALAEGMWIEDRPDSERVTQFLELAARGIRFEYPWPAGSLILWLWKLGHVENVLDGLPAPYRDLLAGRVDATAKFWESRKAPYERAQALMCGSVPQRLQSLEILDSLGATAVAAKLRRDLRAEGVSVPRGKGTSTRGHPAGLTARQAEVLALLGDGLSNNAIADRLFVSPRTVENHVSAILAKLDAAGRDEAVTRARRVGVLADQR
jgi:DNA-binding CsgD family transcriptional regulator